MTSAQRTSVGEVDEARADADADADAYNDADGQEPAADAGLIEGSDDDIWVTTDPVAAHGDAAPTAGEDGRGQV